MSGTVKAIATALLIAALAYGGWWWWTNKVMPPPRVPATLENNFTDTVIVGPSDARIGPRFARTLAPGGRDVVHDLTEPCSTTWVARTRQGQELGEVERLCQGDRLVILSSGSIVLRQG